MLDVTKIAESLQTYGAWGMCSVLIVGIVVLYRNMNTLLEKRHEQFLELVRECTTLITQINVANQRLELMLIRIDKHLIDSEKTLDRADRALEDEDRRRVR